MLRNTFSLNSNIPLPFTTKSEGIFSLHYEFPRAILDSYKVKVMCTRHTEPNNLGCAFDPFMTESPSYFPEKTQWWAHISFVKD
jgi:hypothetical protein